MVFSSTEFMAYFLPVFLLIYFGVNQEYRNYVLLVGSLIFYGFGEPIYISIMMLSIIVNYYIAYNIFDYDSEYFDNKKGQKKRKNLLILSIIYNFGVLFIFKYYNFFAGNINALLGSQLLPETSLPLPIGISFYTFQIVSYVVDVYRRRYQPSQSIVEFGTYVSMFPQLIAGPIVNFSEVSKDLRNRTVKLKDLEEGAGIFILGLASKTLLANKRASLWNEVQTIGPLGIDTPTAWLGAWGFTMQIYFDFFGYSLMAIGLGKILGFSIPVNFLNPYCSKSATQFWRTWHITLGRWFREYVYIPLGGNKKGTGRLIVNILIVWFLTGLWHGADWNFIIWGLFFFAILVTEKLWTGKYLDNTKFLGHAYMLILIPVSWVIFNITDLTTLGQYLSRMFFIPVKGSIAFGGFDKFISILLDYWWLLAICGICSTPFPMRLYEKNADKWYVKIILAALLWYSMYQIFIGSDNPFLYFRF